MGTGKSWWSDDEDIENKKDVVIKVDREMTLLEELDIQLDALETTLNEKHVLSRKDNIKLRQHIANEILNKIKKNKEIDNHPCFQLNKTQRQHFNKELFVLEVLRQCDKLFDKLKRDREFAKKIFYARAFEYFHKITCRLLAYLAQGFIPKCCIADATTNACVGTCLANSSASFCDEDYI